MKISENQVDEFIALYKQEYDVELERTEALEQINALITFVSRMLPNTKGLEENKEMLYNTDATSKVI
jgi:hypothetical protein